MIYPHKAFQKILDYDNPLMDAKRVGFESNLTGEAPVTKNA